ncbi:hypothetical protein [Streptomyces sp. CB01881]|uniref:hypothetical protein n=1 Tax=Streptomyces sp. CB01881 TaxID=2078691 RepID=UPI000CDBBEAD|nr:hypothetical protein [Streptomyces sp. CB01881]AUY53610.1 hypothetical protein C2142_37650 [Streptomyces sp. CB01881]TYC68625.1 hypothetical protein EH183_37660 [Streptomyces sp. CB01881]
MSDHEVTLVALSLTPVQAVAHAAQIREWLLSASVIEQNPIPGTLADPSEFLPGPQAEAVATEDEVNRALTNSGVDIVVGRQVFDSGENLEPPTCPACATMLDSDTYIDLLDDWLRTAEPLATCAACAHAALLGDWAGEWTCQVGELDVCFNNWPPLRPEFTQELGRRLGSRWRVVYGHY